MKTATSRAAPGFSLVEMLVVIVITALTATLVMQGIGQGLGMFRRVTADQGQAYHELMSRGWIRQTLATAVANPPEDDDLLGSAQEIRLRTFRPLLGSEGVATAIVWSITPEGGLEYREGDQSMTVAQGAALLRIEYQDEALAWHDSWPPDDKRQLPARIRLLGAGDESLEITVLTQRSPLVNADELMFDRE